VNTLQAIGRLAARTAVYEALFPHGFERLADLPDWLLARLDPTIVAPVTVSEAQCA
jgi:hypothetical protein